MEEVMSEYLYCRHSLKGAVNRAKNLINKDVSRHIVLKDLAREAGINECTLKRGFRVIFKTSAYQYLISRRMMYAKELIATTEYSEKEIAFYCGYESLSGFITTFRKYFGYTPGNLRKRLLKEGEIDHEKTKSTIMSVCATNRL